MVKKVKINYSYFEWSYFSDILKIISRICLYPAELTGPRIGNKMMSFFDENTLKFSKDRKFQIYLNITKNINTLYKIFKEYELHYNIYKNEKKNIANDQNLLLENNKIIKKIDKLNKKVHTLSYNKIDPKYFIFTFYYMHKAFGKYMVGSKGFNNSENGNELQDISNIKMIMKEPFFTVHIFDVLYDIFDMDELDNLKINEKIINEMYSELIND